MINCQLFLYSSSFTWKSFLIYAIENLISPLAVVLLLFLAVEAVVTLVPKIQKLNINANTP
jgi:hypothetical protein